MNNYEYILASLPVPAKGAGMPDVEALVAEIRSQCSPADNALIDIVLDSFNPDRLDYAFYVKAMKSGNRFIREYFRYDLMVRNTKVEFLNKVLGRPEGTSLMPDPWLESPDGEPVTASPEFDGKPDVLAVLGQGDILGRERGLDSIMWDMADEITRMDLFDADLVLAFIAKIMITDRWNRLDPATGREMFRRLVDEIRQTR